MDYPVRYPGQQLVIPEPQLDLSHLSVEQARAVKGMAWRRDALATIKPAVGPAAGNLTTALWEQSRIRPLEVGETLEAAGEIVAFQNEFNRGCCFSGSSGGGREVGVRMRFALRRTRD